MSVHRRKRKDGTLLSPYWHYEFVIAGRRFRGSTGATTRAEAERTERRLKDEAQRPRDDRTIGGAFGLWWAEKGQHEADARTTFWRMELLKDGLTEVLKRDGQPLTLEAIRTKHVAEYAAIRRATPNKRKRLPAVATVNRELQVLRRIMRYAVEVWELPLTLPRFGKVLAAEPDARSRGIPDEVVAALRAGMREDFRDAFDWLVLVGARAGNALATDNGRWLAPDDVDLAAGTASWRVKSKRPGGRTVTVPLSSAMIAILGNNLGRHPNAVFTYVAKKTWINRAGERAVKGQRYPISYSAFYAEFKRAAAAIKQPHLRVHDLRHTAGTNIYRANGDLVLAQKLLGHSTIVTTRRYADASDQDLREGLELAHARRRQ